MDTVSSVEVRTLQSETVEPFRVLTIELGPEAHVDVTHGKHSVHISIFKPTDDDLRKLAFACGEVK